MNATLENVLISVESLPDRINDAANTIDLVAAAIPAMVTHSGCISPEAAQGASYALLVTLKSMSEFGLDDVEEESVSNSITRFIAEALPSMARDGITKDTADGIFINLRATARLLRKAVQ